MNNKEHFLTMRHIFLFLLTMLALTARAGVYGTSSTDYEGKIVMIKAVIYSDTTAAGRATSDKTVIYLYNGETSLIPLTEDKAAEYFQKDPSRFYWVISKSPSTASSQYYYLSGFKGDRYIGTTTGQNLISGNWDGVTITSTDNYAGEFPVLSFDKWGRQNVTYQYTVEGVSLRFAYKNEDRWLAVSQAGAVNWFNYTTNGATLNGVRWTTNLEITEVQTTTTIGEYGSLDAPKEFGFPITLTRSNDGAAVTTTEDYDYYGTLRLNFAVELPDGLSAYTLSKKTNVSNAEVMLAQHTNKTTTSLSGTEKNILARESPVLLRMKHSEGDEDLQKTIYLRPEKAQTFVSTGFKGTLGKTTYADSVYAGATDTLTYYILSKKGGRVAFRPMANQTLAANKAFYEWRPADATSGAKHAAALSFIFLDEDDDNQTTAIKQPAANSAAAADAPIFDLTGRPVAAPLRPGIYIQNGRKFIQR